MLKRLKHLISGLATIGISCSAVASTRIDVPIGQVVLPNGDTRYFVQLSIGEGKPFDALLDTGSFGLRVLKSAVRPEDYRSTHKRHTHVFASGTLFGGDLADATLRIGEARTDRPVLIQVIDDFKCVERRPNCPASKVSADEFRMAGGGFPNQGFKAILGVSMRRAPSGENSENPLIAMGDSSWIIVLPPPEAKAPGHLIINPTAEDRAGFVLVQLRRQPNRRPETDGMTSRSGKDSGTGWMDGALPGCLLDETSKRKYCGRTLLDTGAPGFSVDAAEVDGPQSWPAGMPARFEIDAGDRPITISFVAGSEPTYRIRLHPPHNPAILRISAGTLPYLSFAVLYDAKVGAIGFKSRNDTRR